jgi:hypothetical protein
VGVVAVSDTLSGPQRVPTRDLHVNHQSNIISN